MLKKKSYIVPARLGKKREEGATGRIAGGSVPSEPEGFKICLAGWEKESDCGRIHGPQCLSVCTGDRAC